MDTAAVVSVVLANVLVWGGGFLFVRWLMRRAKREFSEFPPVAAPVQVDGFTVEFLSCHVPGGMERASRIPWTEYQMPLRGKLAELSIVDEQAFRARTERVVPRLPIRRVQKVDTADDGFDGQFMFTEPPTPGVTAALADPRVRDLLVQLRDAYDGLYIEAGLVRVVEAGRPDEASRQTHVEVLVGIAAQLEVAAP